MVTGNREIAISPFIGNPGSRALPSRRHNSKTLSGIIQLLEGLPGRLLATQFPPRPYMYHARVEEPIGPQNNLTFLAPKGACPSRKQGAVAACTIRSVTHLLSVTVSRLKPGDWTPLICHVTPNPVLKRLEL